MISELSHRTYNLQNFAGLSIEEDIHIQPRVFLALHFAKYQFNIYSNNSNILIVFVLSDELPYSYPRLNVIT